MMSTTYSGVGQVIVTEPTTRLPSTTTTHSTTSSSTTTDPVSSSTGTAGAPLTVLPPDEVAPENRNQLLVVRLKKLLQDVEVQAKLVFILVLSLTSITYSYRFIQRYIKKYIY